MDDHRAYKTVEKECALEFTGKIWTRPLIRNLIKHLPEKLEKIMKPPFERVTWSGNNNKWKEKVRSFIKFIQTLKCV